MLPFYKEENMIFKPMPLVEVKEFYEKLKAEAPSTIVKIAMDDIWFFTDGLQKDYGRVMQNGKVQSGRSRNTVL